MRFSAGLLGVLTVLFGAAPAAADGGFMLSCTSPQLLNSLNAVYLAASCKNAAGNYVSTNINLNRCIVNNGGLMFCQENGGFWATCTDFELSTSGTTARLFAYCLNQVGAWLPSAVNLENCIGNQNGVLAC